MKYFPILANECTRLVEYALSTLEDTERLILEARYYDEKTLREIATELNLSRERVRQIEAKALRKMRHPQRIEILDSYVEGWTSRGH